jgi:hypothetical protein
MEYIDHTGIERTWRFCLTVLLISLWTIAKIASDTYNLNF